VWCKNNPQYELIARFESPTNGEPKWWNGIDIWSFDRSKQSRPGINGSRHAINKLRYGPLYENTLIAAHKAVGAVRKTTSNA
jgi:hypothetical protein